MSRPILRLPRAISLRYHIPGMLRLPRCLSLASGCYGSSTGDLGDLGDTTKRMGIQHLIVFLEGAYRLRISLVRAKRS